MAFSLRKLRPRSITQKILATIFIISSVVTLIITAIQISFDYYQEMNALKKSLMLVERSYSRSVVASLWELNETQIQTQLDGIISIPGIESAAISYKGKILESSGIESNRFIEKKIDLIHLEKNGASNYLGQLIIHASVDQVLDKLLNRIFIIFITQFIKTLLVSAILFFSIQQLFTRHLIQIASFVKHIDIKSKEILRLNRNEKYFSADDELESLVGSINEMRENLTSSYDELEQLNSEQRRQLEISSRMSSLGEMAGGIAHEINNPLTIIGTSSRLLKKRVESGETTPDKLNSYFEKIDKTTERITKIINGMLMISRDASTESFTVFTWNEIINDVLALCGEKFKHMGIEIKIVDHPVCLHKPFTGGKIQLSQVLLNLLHNSYDAIVNLDEKWIEISCEIIAKDFIIRITDSGKGIPYELHDKIMQPFFTTKEVGKGTGLGLSLSMSIIKNHGGELSIDNNSSHTSFIIKLPMV
jgi:C4-dicarboxylate-specific signal transduction histidine kinase